LNGRPALSVQLAASFKRMEGMEKRYEVKDFGGKSKCGKGA